MNLLVVDFDFFFPNHFMLKTNGALPPDAYLFDWGHSEAQTAIQSALWTIRASGFLRHDLPLPDLSGEQTTFWDRIHLKPKATLYYADSNSQAAGPKLAASTKQLWLYDAHHDSGYQGADTIQKITRSKSFDCENWMLKYHWQGTELHLRYPRWREDAFQAEENPYLGPDDLDRAFDDGTPPPVTFDRVFVCRSGAWVPSWHDQTFLDFLAAAPVVKRIDLTHDTTPRTFDRAAAQQMADQTKSLMQTKTNPATLLSPREL